MSEINTQPVSSQQWSSASTPTTAESTTDIKDVQELYKTHREAEQRLIYNQLTANDYKPASKSRGSRMASLVAQQRFVI